MAERTFFKLPSLPQNQHKTPKEENIISNETRKEPQPQTTKYEDYLPNAEKLWSKKRCWEMTKHKQKTSSDLKPWTGYRYLKLLLVLKVHCNDPLTTTTQFKGMGKPQEI